MPPKTFYANISDSALFCMFYLYYLDNTLENGTRTLCFPNILQGHDSTAF